MTCEPLDNDPYLCHPRYDVTLDNRKVVRSLGNPLVISREKLIFKRKSLSSNDWDATKQTLSYIANRFTLVTAQKVLKDLGYKLGTIDGIMGPKTRSAIKSYQSNNSLAVTGELDSKTMTSLYSYLE